MRGLIIGGTGNISTAITHIWLQSGKGELWHYNRGSREAPNGVRTMIGDRRDFARFERQVAEAGAFDCVIDMVGFLPDEIESAIRAFRGRIGHYIYCSTVDVYTKRADRYPIDEDHSRRALPSFPYAYNKALCEDLLLAAHDARTFPVTLLRPAQTYGGAGFAVASVGGGVYQMRRLREGRPIVVHGDGTSIWVACHRDDVARAFVNAAGNAAAFGRAYNVTGEEWLTYDAYWRTVVRALGAPEPRIVHIPTDLLGQLLPRRAEWCRENFRYNNLFDNTSAKRDLGFRYSIPWEEGIRGVVSELDRLGRIERSEEEPFYDVLLDIWEQHSRAMAEEMRRRLGDDR